MPRNLKSKTWDNFTGIQNETKNSGQPTYTEKLLEKFGMQDCNPVGTPVDVSSKLLVQAWLDTLPNQLKLTGQRYLKGATHYGILYSRNESTICVGYSASDWAGDVNDRKSTSGYLFQVSEAVLRSQQPRPSISSAAQESVWLRKIIAELGSPQTTPTTIYEDNK